ncbi:Neurochondrin-domain-containing protein [Kalaharituber pfeilii]|nr:Neurochondrin-domain-containing protein [Kalaharituber pfeilii]
MNPTFHINPQPSSSTGPPPAAPTTPSADSQTVTQCLSYLQAKDDTARFVGLAMLASILKNVTERTILRKCWEAMNYKFLDRLLKSGQSAKTPPEQAKDMVELAVNVIHAFSLLLPGASENIMLVLRAPGLIAASPQSSEDTMKTIIETLLVFATGEKGSVAVLNSELTPFLEVAPRFDHGLQVILVATINGLKTEAGTNLMIKILPEILLRYSNELSTSDRPVRLRILSFLSELLSQIPSQLLPPSTDWVTTIYTTIRTLITSTHNEKERTYATIICASLLHTYPPNLLFQTSDAPSPTGKPFTFFFIRLILIDIRTTFPALLEQLSSPSYTTISHRLAADFDVIAAYIGYLVVLDSLDATFPDPEILLKLRSEICETFSLTIEFLRDRWDAAYAGAAGYEMDTSEDQKRKAPRDEPLNLTWDSKDIEGGAPRDPLVISAVRALSLWLREDDSLRKEAGGLMDLFLGLWKQSTDEDAKSKQYSGLRVDYRLWLVCALEGTITERNGKEAFQNQHGWELLWEDVKKAYVTRNIPVVGLHGDHDGGEQISGGK